MAGVDNRYNDRNPMAGEISSVRATRFKWVVINAIF